MPHRAAAIAAACVLAACLALVGCGRKGDLYLPQPPADGSEGTSEPSPEG